jgi:hypothetical protein
MSEELFTDGPEFRRVVLLLRAMPAPFRSLALHASLFWDDERIAAFNDDVREMPEPASAVRH